MEVTRSAKRQRTSKACIPCRQLKRKCDSEEPCSTCVRFRYDCTYVGQRRLKSTEKKSTDASTVEPEHGTGKEPASPQVNGNITLHHGILDPGKSRYLDVSSAIAFPRVLGVQFDARKAPRLHSFAWNLGIRSEPLSKAADDLKGMVSLDDVHVYSNQYFAMVNPFFDILDQLEFTRRASRRWKDGPMSESAGFDLILCGVVALGHFFSEKIDDGTECALTAYAKDRLESITLKKPCSIDLIAAWVLRTIYLRATTRPHASWMASNITMHQIQAAGLHHHYLPIAVTDGSLSHIQAGQTQSLYKQKVFWVARAINATFCYEYSRPRINIDRISCPKLDTDASICGPTKVLLEIADLIPEESQSCETTSLIAQTKLMLDSIANFTAADPPAVFMYTDTAFAAYRHLRPTLNIRIASSSEVDPTVSHLLDLGHKALKVIRGYLSQPSPAPWWSLISIPFQFVLILLSLDTTESLSQIAHALEILTEVAASFDTHLTREAVQNAKTLIRLSQNRKERDAQILRNAIGLSAGGLEDEDSAVADHGEAETRGSDTPFAGQQRKPEQESATRAAPDSSTDYQGIISTGLDNGEGGIEFWDPDNLSLDWDAIFASTKWT